MDAGLFNENAPGRLVKISTDYGYDWAFVPDPLPPELNLSDLGKALESASLALGALEVLSRDVRDPRLFVKPFIRREARFGSIIEGTVVDTKDLYAYETGQLVLPGLSDEREAALREVLNYVEAIDFAFYQNELPLSLRLIRKLHEILTYRVRGGEVEPGRFRSQPAGVRGEQLKEAAFIAPPVTELKACLKYFEEYLHAEDKYSKLIRLGLIHYQFETIHPFRDGNGRIGRLLIHLLFMEWGLLSRPLLYLSRYFEKHKKAYCDLMFNVSAKGAWHEWLRFFLEAVTTEATDMVTRINALGDLRQEWRELISGRRASASTLRLADALTENPMITYKATSDILSVSYSVARYSVDRLVKAGILTPYGRSKYPKTFVSDRVFEILFSE